MSNLFDMASEFFHHIGRAYESLNGAPVAPEEDEEEVYEEAEEERLEDAPFVDDAREAQEPRIIGPVEASLRDVEGAGSVFVLNSKLLEDFEEFGELKPTPDEAFLLVPLDCDCCITAYGKISVDSIYDRLEAQKLCQKTVIRGLRDLGYNLDDWTPLEEYYLVSDLNRTASYKFHLIRRGRGHHVETIEAATKEEILAALQELAETSGHDFTPPREWTPECDLEDEDE